MGLAVFLLVHKVSQPRTLMIIFNHMLCAPRGVLKAQHDGGEQGNQMSGFHDVLTAGCRMLKKPLTSGTNRARNVNNATKLHDAATARIHLVQMDRPLFKSRYVAAVSGA